jgi:hypothetical protein
MPRIRPTVAALAVAVAACSAALAAPASAAPVQVPFSFSGAGQFWVVPAGVTEAAFTLQGGAGGSVASGADGGLGAELRATIPVTPGERLTILVGGQGTDDGLAGFNGGGTAVAGAGSGGGATTVLSGTGATLLVAGGGGGAGAAGTGTAPGAGGGGGDAGTAGAPGVASGGSTPGGGGLAIGVGGVAGTGPIDGVVGGTTTDGSGGLGAEAPGGSAGGDGGAGGGGFVGGGGGGAGGAADASTQGAGGGGGAGGQSFATANATGVLTSLAAQRGNGVAVVSYEPLARPEVRTQPTLSGVAQAGRALTCEPGTWSGSPSLAVAWLRDGTAIAGATATTYTLQTADAGKQLACQVTATNAAGSTVARTPAVTVSTGPANAVAPTVAGSSVLNGRLACAAGTWSGSPTFAYAWLRNGVAIRGQTRSTYTLTRADAGQAIQCAVTGTVDGASATAQSTAVGGPARLVILTTTALVSRTGAVTVQVACFGPTACAVPRMTATSGQVIARAGSRTIRSGASSKYRIALGRRGKAKLRRSGSSIAVRFVAVPNGGYGGNARISFVALRGIGG